MAVCLVSWSGSTYNWQEGRRQGGQVKMWDRCSHSGGCRVGWHGGQLAAVCHAADSYGAYN
jgi:hypothetical protein